MTIAAMESATSPKPAKTVRGMPRWGDVLLRAVAGLVLLYLFLPIFVIILFSFNKPAGKFNYSWQGFTLDNWANPFKYPALTEALMLSLEIAAISTAIALVLGTLVAIALVRQRWRGQKAVDTFLILPLTAPEVVIEAAMLSFALSLDDFIITYFVSGSTTTYPLYVNAAVKAAVPPQINVLATAILVISLILLAAGTLLRRKRFEG